MPSLASFLVRPAEGIERPGGTSGKATQSELHSWYDPQRVLKVLIDPDALAEACGLHSWYDPQRVLKVPSPAVPSLAQPWLHSWYDPQRVFKERKAWTCGASSEERFIPGTTRRGY